MDDLDDVGSSEEPGLLKGGEKPHLGMKIRILAVDDEQDLLDYLSLLLSREGFEVKGLADPKKVLDELRSRDRLVGFCAVDLPVHQSVQRMLRPPQRLR